MIIIIDQFHLRGIPLAGSTLKSLSMTSDYKSDFLSFIRVVGVRVHRYISVSFSPKVSPAHFAEKGIFCWKVVKLTS